MRRYDTVVVGAGPAGVWAAKEASARGSVLLVDASPVPRDKSCGGMLNEYAQSFLTPVGSLPDSLVLHPRHVNFRYVDWDRGIRKPTGLRFINVDRRAFDVWLLDLLDDWVEVIAPCALETLTQDANGVVATLRTPDATHEVTCANLVGADGARSAVRRTLGVGATATYVTLQDFVKLRGPLEPFFDCIYMRGIGDSYAYSYVVPKGGRAIVGSVFYPRTKRPHLKQDMALGILRETIPQLGETISREASVALSVRSPHDVVPGVGRVLLAGEAGGFMSPTSGEGISYAMNTGRLAGLAIAGHDPADALEGYANATHDVRRNIARKLRWLPFMESPTGKYLAGFVPTSLVSRVTKGL